MPIVIIIEMGGDLGCNNIQKHGEPTVCKTTYMTRVKNIALHNSYQVDEIVMEIEEWKYKKF